MDTESLKEIEVQVRPDTGKAVIEGKTAVPFQSFVTLVLQRKVLQMTKQWGREPIVVNSELLTHLASAPQDSVENRSHLVTVSIGVGVVGGVFASAVALLALQEFGIQPGRMEFGIVVGGIAALGILLVALMKARRVRRGEKLIDAVESLSAFLGK
ncbi:MAG: hypothetical protein G01um101425_163 [Candidatus Peregrinibacteria bacterium Gr01-1014_25]|nr:MAG: hypothetical protein G01um101425_163 [Candidatus Peregrinibacteria bacterium Gr01-1014_25]